MKHLIKITLIMMLISILKIVNSEETVYKYPAYYSNENVYDTSPIITRSTNSNTYNSPVILRRSSNDHQVLTNVPKIVPTIPSCGCAAQVRCPPCGGLFLTSNIVSCPCAPKPICQACPPLSLIHKIAAKKVLIILKIRQSKIQEQPRILSILHSNLITI